MRGLLGALGVCALAVGLPSISHSQSAVEMAADIKSWRENCNDPDPDIRLAYVKKALDGSDVAIKRICVRLALESDNADIQNLGLRAALSMIPRLTFSVMEPPVLAKAKAELARKPEDERRAKEIAGWFITRDYDVVSAGLVFEIDGANIDSGTSRWFPLARQTRRHDRYQGQATIVGSRVNWTGSANMPSLQEDCQLNVSLASGGVLRGSFKCGRVEAMSVSASLL